MASSATERVSDHRPIDRQAANQLRKGWDGPKEYRPPAHRQDAPHKLKSDPHNIAGFKRGRLHVVGCVPKSALGLKNGSSRYSARCTCGYYEIFTLPQVKLMRLGKGPTRCSRCEYEGTQLGADEPITLSPSEASYIARVLSTLPETKRTRKLIARLSPSTGRAER